MIRSIPGLLLFRTHVTDVLSTGFFPPIYWSTSTVVFNGLQIISTKEEDDEP